MNPVTQAQLEAMYSKPGHPAYLNSYYLSGNREALGLDRDDLHLRVEAVYTTGEVGCKFVVADCPPMCACTDDLTDCPIPAENAATDEAQRWNEQRGA